MFERFTTDARAVVIATRVPELGVEEIDPVHLLWALTHEGCGASRVLAAHGIVEPEVAGAMGLERHADHPGGKPLDASDAEALLSLGIDLDAIRKAVETRFGEGALDEEQAAPSDAAGDEEVVLVHGPPRGRVRFGLGRVRFGRGAKKVLELAVREAVRARSREIRSEHIALGVLRSDDVEVRRVLQELGVDEDALRLDLEGRMRHCA